MQFSPGRDEHPDGTLTGNFTPCAYVGTQPTSHTAKRFIRTSLPRGLFKLGTLMAIPMRVPRAAIIAVYAVDNGLSDHLVRSASAEFESRAR